MTLRPGRKLGRTQAAILNRLGQGRATVAELAEAAGASEGAIRASLLTLRRKYPGLLWSRQTYALNCGTLVAILGDAPCED